MRDEECARQCCCSLADGACVLPSRRLLQKKWGWQCRYVQQYNAIGEAPDEVRQCFQQRSRWCKGHFQTFWSKQCPLVDRRLGLLFQLCYSSTCLSYISAGVTTATVCQLAACLVFFHAANATVYCAPTSSRLSDNIMQ